LFARNVDYHAAILAIFLPILAAPPALHDERAQSPIHRSHHQQNQEDGYDEDSCLHHDRRFVSTLCRSPKLSRHFNCCEQKGVCESNFTPDITECRRNAVFSVDARLSSPTSMS